jgi:isochorismate pyruvate lyase
VDCFALLAMTLEAARFRNVIRQALVTKQGAPSMKLRLVAAIMALASAALASVPSALADDAADHPAYWGSPSVEGGKCCARLAEVRANIDRIDKQIVALMAERGQYVAEAGRFKADPAAVSAPARVEAIIAKVKDLARQDGLAESVAERSYRAMIAAFEDYEREEWARRNPGAAPAK